MVTRRKLTKEDKLEDYNDLIEIYHECSKNHGIYADRFARFAINWYEYGGNRLWTDKGYACEWVKRFDRHSEYIDASGLCKQAIIDADGDMSDFFLRRNIKDYLGLRTENEIEKELIFRKEIHEEVMRKELSKLNAYKTSRKTHKKTCPCKKLADELDRKFKNIL